MIALRPFTPEDFERLIQWVDSKELLLTIAGNVLSYPLTNDQLQKYLDDPGSISFSIVDTDQDKVIGHAELIPGTDGMIKIDKLLVGDPAARGKGVGETVINLLLDYSFNLHGVHTVELNVFDWNKAGIRCYEKCGFVENPAKQQLFPVGDETWVAFNMTISKNDWLTRNEVKGQ
jgi:RimJ/RimL family protein N-acetyltransferase